MVVAMSQLILVPGVETIHSSSAIKLASKHLVSLAEAVELSCQVYVLTLENRSVLFKGLLLGQKLAVSISVLRGDDSEVFNVTAGNI